jgi:hypothetical protein
LRRTRRPGIVAPIDAAVGVLDVKEGFEVSTPVGGAFVTPAITSPRLLRS